MSDISEPNTYEQAIASGHHKEWHASMTKEWTELMSNNTFHEPINRSSLPPGRRVTKSRWVYKIKLNKDGSIERYKSRFVVCGYSQVKGVDYTKSFSATLRSSSLRTMIALAAGQKLKLEHFDVTNAFTQSEIDSDIYIEHSTGHCISHVHSLFFHARSVARLLRSRFKFVAICAHHQTEISALYW